MSTGFDLVSTGFDCGFELVSKWFRLGFDVTSDSHVLRPCGLGNIYCLNPNLTVKFNFDLISRSKLLNIIKSTEIFGKYCTYFAVVDR